MIKFFEEYRIKNQIKGVFDSVMDKKEDENMYMITETFVKYYGFDAIVYIPPTLSLIDFRKYLPSLSSAYGGNVIAEYSKDNRSIYMRCHLQGLDIAERDMIKFKWYKHFSTSKTFRNAYGETFTIQSVKNIMNPNDDKEIIGYNLKVHICEGLDYNALLSEEDSLSKVIGRTFVTWDDKSNCADVEIITKLLSNKEPFKIVKCEPYQLYCASTYSYKPILLDFKTSANVIFGGINGSGKSVAELSCIINLACQYTRDDFKIYVSFVSDKADLRLLSRLPQCDYYGNTIEESLSVMRYLVKETKRRNNIFEKCKKFVTNIFDYNKFSKEKLPFLYFVSDEITDFMVEAGDKGQFKKQKEEFMSLFSKLSRTGRSAGIWIIIATQRASRDNLPSSIKGQLNCVVCYKQVNTASAMTLFGSGEQNATRVTRLNKANRECLIEYQEGIVLAKLLYLTNDMMEEIIKDVIIETPNYLDLDIEGNIVIQKPLEIAKIVPKTDEKPLKSSEKVIFITKKPKSRWQEAQERKVK